MGKANSGEEFGNSSVFYVRRGYRKQKNGNANSNTEVLFSLIDKLAVCKMKHEIKGFDKSSGATDQVFNHLVSSKTELSFILRRFKSIVPANKFRFFFQVTFSVPSVTWVKSSVIIVTVALFKLTLIADLSREY